MQLTQGIAELERLRQSTAHNEAQLADARAEVAQARAEAEAAEARAQAHATAAVEIARIPRPRGMKGGLQAAMGLKDDDELYSSIQVSNMMVEIESSSICPVPPMLMSASDFSHLTAHCSTGNHPGRNRLTFDSQGYSS